LGSLFFAACAPLPQQAEAEASAPATPRSSDKGEPQERTSPAKPRMTAREKPKRPGPIPARAINVATTCSFRDETGYSGALTLRVEEAQVREFIAEVAIPKRGVCRFNLKAFRQTQALPTVELSHTRDACKVRVWEQGERLTVAFDTCRKMCSGDAWPYLWPILNDRRDGSCA